MGHHALKSVAALALSLSFAFAMAVPGLAADDTQTPEWQDLHQNVFDGRAIESGEGKIALDTPIRAEDAALTPVGVTMPADFAKDVKVLTILIDKNPSPVVGTFTYGPAAGNGERKLMTRVRVDQYSYVRAVAETNDGKLYMVANFVKASGGCSAPASKDAETAAKTLGKMKVKTAIGKTSDGLNQEAQVMIKHPNNSGLAMDQLTGLYAPAHFITSVEVKSGDAVVFKMEGGISISEDPNLRFTYAGKSSDVMAVTATDSEGGVFQGRSTPANPS